MLLSQESLAKAMTPLLSPETLEAELVTQPQPGLFFNRVSGIQGRMYKSNFKYFFHFDHPGWMKLTLTLEQSRLSSLKLIQKLGSPPQKKPSGKESDLTLSGLRRFLLPLSKRNAVELCKQ